MVTTDLSIEQDVSKQSLYGGQLAGREGVLGAPFPQVSMRVSACFRLYPMSTHF